MCEFDAQALVDLDQARRVHPESFQRGQKRNRSQMSQHTDPLNHNGDNGRGDSGEDDSRDTPLPKRYRKSKKSYKPLKGPFS